jgi:uncharacterized membrane protein YbaN (DUF454 family)
MRQKIKALLILGLAIIFIVIGLASLVLPFLPGWLFLVIGLLLLSVYFPRMRDWMDRRTERWPKVHALIHRIRRWMDQGIGTQ